ncbi:MAG: lipoyl(octanoyl) transferase LipB [Bacteroidota bacterium]
MQTVHFADLGEIEYGAAWQKQEELMQQNIHAKADWYSKSDTERPTQLNTKHYLLFCMHPHVYTLGKSGHMENLLVNDTRMKELNVTFYKTNRGGDITYHGPGQIVGYPIFDLELFFTDLGKYMRSLEEVMIRVLSVYGIKGDRLRGSTGVWLDPETPRARKICAMGVRCSRWVTMHGFALNVNTDLRYFDYIVPCGITDKSVTSLKKELGQEVNEDEVKDLLIKEFENVFGVRMANFIVPENLGTTSNIPN